jgi:hypothetical protein
MSFNTDVLCFYHMALFRHIGLVSDHLASLGRVQAWIMILNRVNSAACSHYRFIL